MKDEPQNLQPSTFKLQPSIVALARNAMATRFEIVLHGESETRLRAAGEAALDEVDRLEAQLSLYRPTSEIANVNARAAHEPVRISPETFSLLECARKFSAETGGAFDITIAPLVRAWGFMGDTGHQADSKELSTARNCVGMHLIEMDANNFTVRFLRPGVMLDLGAIGKGYAVERAAEILREAEIFSALIHGGTSTMCAIGAPPNASAWNIAVKYPKADNREPPLLANIPLRDEALSMSAIWGRSFESGGRTFGHVIDPRTGEPARNALLSVVASTSATESDALSTALLVVGAGGFSEISQLRAQLRALVVDDGRRGEFQVESRGIPIVSET